MNFCFYNMIQCAKYFHTDYFITSSRQCIKFGKTGTTIVVAENN